MNLILVMREEIVCLVIQILLLVYNVTYNKGEEGRRFLRICTCALTHVVFDVITIYTVNHLDTVPELVNKVCHQVFFLSAILFCYEFFNYVCRVSYSKRVAKKIRIVSSIVPILYLCLMPFLEIEYLEGNGTNYSFGPCVYAGYGCTVILFAASVATMLAGYKKIEKGARRALFPMVGLMAFGVAYQIFIPEFLFTGAELTLVSVGMCFSLESPTKRYMQRAFIDMNTSVKNKNCYDEEVASLEKKRHLISSKGVTCIVCDLNGLKFVNDNYGHLAGDELIRLAASLLKSSLKHAYGVYRVGGDEFVAIYVGEHADKAEEEVESVKQASGKMRTRGGQPLSIAIGVAKGGELDSVLDVVSQADKMMYVEKTRMKKGRA